MSRKGIILAGGYGTRLAPLTNTISKQLLPVYNKPMIYYPVSTLMSIGIRDILIITTPRDRQLFENLLGTGSGFGINIQYATQDNPRGIAEAFIIGEDFIGKDDITLILGDNIFYGENLYNLFDDIYEHRTATIFGYYVKNPTAYGVACFDQDTHKVITVEEKPVTPKTNYAIPGLYYFPNDVVKKAKRITPSNRGELEITSIINEYIKESEVIIHPLTSTTWFDAGTFDALLEVSNFVHSVEKRTGIRFGDPVDVARKKGWVLSYV